MSNLNNSKRIAKNTLLLYLRTFFTMGISLFTSRIVLEALGVDDYGTYNVVGGIVAMFSFLNGSMSASTSRFITIEIGTGDLFSIQKIFSISIVNHLIIALFVFILAETVGLWYVHNKLVVPSDRFNAALWVYQFSILSTIFTLLQTPFNAMIIANEKMDLFALGGILAAVLQLTVAFIINSVSQNQLVWYGALILCVGLIMFCFYSTICYIIFPCTRFILQRDYSQYKTMFLYSGWDLFGNISVVAQGQGINLVLNLFFGTVVNAARGVAFQVQGAVSQFAGNFMTAVRPQIMKYYAVGDIDNMFLLVFKSAKYSFFLLWFFALPLIVEIDYVLSLWLKQVPEYTALFTRLALLTNLVSTWRIPFISAMHATGNIKLLNIICGSLLISALPFSYLFLYLGFPPSSAFVVVLVITIITLFIELILIRQTVYFSITKSVQSILIPSIGVAVASIICPFLINQAMTQSFIRFLLVSFVSVISCFISIYSFGVNCRERLIIINNIKNRLHLK